MSRRSPTIPDPDPAIRVDEPTAGHPAAPAVGSGNLLPAVGLATLLAAFWAGIAWLSPTTTFHLAPLLVVVAPLWVTRNNEALSAHPYLPAFGSAGIATVTTGILRSAGLLAGPTFTGTGGTTLEALALIALGFAWSLFRIHRRRHRTCFA